jgi:hypothetical protein
MRAVSSSLPGTCEWADRTHAFHFSGMFFPAASAIASDHEVVPRSASELMV